MQKFLSIYKTKFKIHETKSPKHKTKRLPHFARALNSLLKVVFYRFSSITLSVTRPFTRSTPI